jgi:hypothetical protein
VLQALGPAFCKNFYCPFRVFFSFLKKNGATELNNEIFQILLGAVEAETLGKKIAIALNQRSQGRFDKALLNIREANRAQVLSIREIQAVIDRAKGKLKTEG